LIGPIKTHSDLGEVMTRFAILLGGELTVTARLRRQIEGARALAADAGMAHAAALNLVPEMWLGDFDSAGSELVIAYTHVPRRAFPAAKDKTDGALAIEEALALGATELVLVGGFGGQADHVLGHFGQLLGLAHAGVRAIMTSGNEEAHAVVPGALAIDLEAGTRFSLVPFSDLHGLDLAGVTWPLVKRDVPLGSTLTLSNVAEGPVHVALAQGYGIAIAYP
jgi:thiamine pyrophosphokinase